MDKGRGGAAKLPWVNSLWASLCGGLDDDAAFGGEPGEVCRLVDIGLTIQTGPSRAQRSSTLARAGTGLQ